jgi:hypothetical protein
MCKLKVTTLELAFAVNTVKESVTIIWLWAERQPNSNNVVEAYWMMEESA